MHEIKDHPGVIAKPPIIYGVALVVGLVLQGVSPLPIAGSPIRSWVGLVIIALGGLLAYTAIKTFERWKTPKNPARPTTTIVTSGPYRYSRNPMYVSLTLILLGLGLSVNSGWLILMAAPVLVIMHVGVIFREERYLEDKFGQVYLDYKSAVRRWL
jgi:protein-S-isoprenylcysteine O-methyltransferase Ste14